MKHNYGHAEHERSISAYNHLRLRDLRHGLRMKIVANTFAQPKLVAPRPLEPPRPGATMTLKLPRQSYSVVHLATS